MEKLNATQQHFAPEGAQWPTALKTAREVSEYTGIDEARLLELADAHYCPHWRIENGSPMFQMKEIKKWLADNILNRIEGKEIPINLRVMVEPPSARDAPDSIREIKHLKELITCNTPPGVYFLVKNNEVVYVGQSVSPGGRVAMHAPDKDFDSAYMVPVPSTSLDAVEGALIRALRPPLNGRCGKQKGSGKRRMTAPGNGVCDIDALNSIGIDRDSLKLHRKTED